MQTVFQRPHAVMQSMLWVERGSEQRKDDVGQGGSSHIDSSLSPHSTMNTAGGGKLD